MHLLQIVDLLLKGLMAACCRSCNYQSFMELYATAPRMAPYLMDLWLPRIRAATLKVLLLAYRPTALPMTFVASCLGFEGIKEVRVLVREQHLVSADSLDGHSAETGPRIGRAGSVSF